MSTAGKLMDMPKYDQKFLVPWGFEPQPWFLGLTRVHSPNGTSVGSAVSVGYPVVTKEHTETQTTQ